MITGATWSIWTDEEESLRVWCSLCGGEVKQAVVVPECELGICFGCLDELVAAANVVKEG